jgi:MFS family permease
LLIAGASIGMLAPAVEVLYAGRALQGAGIALLVNAGLRSILFARPGRGAAMTLYGIASTIGSVIGLISSGLLTGDFGWRSVFALSAVLGVLLTLLPVISTRVARRSIRPVEQHAPFVGGAIALRSYAIPLAINFLIFCNYSIWVILPLYAEQRFDASPEMTANLLLIITITHLAAAYPVSRAIRRFGATSVLVFSIALAVIGSVGILLANSVWMLALPIVFYGSGMVGSVNSAGDIVLHRGGGGSRAVGALRQTSDLGLVIGPIVAGTIADVFSYRTPFVAFPILMIVAAIVGALASSRESTERAQ